MHPPRLHRGLIVSGDRFVSSHDEVNALRAALPDALAVEMEGAALAQVCFEHGVAVRGRAHGLGYRRCRRA